MEWYISVLKNYAVFSGRARRKEYWMFFLINNLIGTLAFALELWLHTDLMHLGQLPFVYSIAVFIPGLAVVVRRLHDVGRSAWSLLFLLIPVFGGFAIFFFMMLKGDPHTNAYGPSPK